jgi:hypothetical protein
MVGLALSTYIPFDSEFKLSHRYIRVGAGPVKKLSTLSLRGTMAKGYVIRHTTATSNLTRVARFDSGKTAKILGGMALASSP